MKTLAEMTTEELWDLIEEVDARISEVIKAGQGTNNPELARFRMAIDDELDRRGA
jgi:hypothetical protein